MRCTVRRPQNVRPIERPCGGLIVDGMKKLLCQDVGFTECNWEFTGESDDEVVRKAREHGKRMHAVELDDGKLRPKIRSA